MRIIGYTREVLHCRLIRKLRLQCSIYRQWKMLLVVVQTLLSLQGSVKFHGRWLPRSKRSLLSITVYVIRRRLGRIVTYRLVLELYPLTSLMSLFSLCCIMTSLTGRWRIIGRGCMSSQGRWYTRVQSRESLIMGLISRVPFARRIWYHMTNFVLRI